MVSENLCTHVDTSTADSLLSFSFVKKRWPDGFTTRNLFGFRVETASRRSTRKNGYKRPMPTGTLNRNRSIVGGTKVPGTGQPMFQPATKTSDRPEHDSSDEGVSNCGPFWAPSHSDPVCLSVPVDDGCIASRELSSVPPGCFSSPQSSWQPFTGTNAPGRKLDEPPENTTVDVESLDAPAPSTPYITSVHEFVHHVQFGIMPKRLPLPHPDDEIPSSYEEDVLSIQDGKTAWVMVDPASILERHLVRKGSAMPIYRGSHDRRHSSPNLKYHARENNFERFCL